MVRFEIRLLRRRNRKERKRKEAMRKNLKEARRKAGMTQKQMAEYLKIDLRTYQRMEAGETPGSIRVWDTLEDLFEIPQRQLRQESQS